MDDQSIEKEIKEYQKFQKMVKSTDIYKKIDKKISQFFKLCNENKIIARRNFTFCKTDGFAEIGDERKNHEKYFIFYHSQQADFIIDEVAKHIAEEKTTKISIHLQWGVFKDKDDVEEYHKMATKVQKIAQECELVVKYDKKKNIEQTLVLVIPF